MQRLMPVVVLASLLSTGVAMGPLAGSAEAQNRNRDRPTVENDETHWVGNDRRPGVVRRGRTETVDNNETITINGNRTAPTRSTQPAAPAARQRPPRQPR